MMYNIYLSKTIGIEKNGEFLTFYKKITPCVNMQNII